MGRKRIVVSDFVAQVAARLRVLRFERGLSQRELARRAGFSPDNIVRFELGYTAMNARTMHKLARALDVQPLDILNCDTQTNDLGWFIETMRHDASVVRFVLAKLGPGSSARAARAA